MEESLAWVNRSIIVIVFDSPGRMASVFTMNEKSQDNLANARDMNSPGRMRNLNV